MSRRSSVLALSALLVVLVVAGLALRRRAADPPRDTTGSTAAAARPPAPAVASARPSPDAALDHALPDLDRYATDRPASEEEDPDDIAAKKWANVDFDAIRAALPDNLYWKMAMPTTDPEVLRQREEERTRWNLEYGKVLSNTATAEEIDTYYAERQQLSEDYLEFIVYLLTNYGYQIPMRDVAALKLAAEMHHARLEEIPRQITEAQQRREAHEAARRAWLAEQKQFADDDADAD